MLHFETVEPNTLELLKKLMDKPYLSTFNLVGGTAFALQIGHRPLRTDTGIRLLSPEDIAPMKFDAIAGRGKKKDFYDLYFLLEKMTLTEMLDLHREKFNLSTIFHIVKSLTYFEDAEDDDDPVLVGKNITWEQVKKRIVKSVARL